MTSASPEDEEKAAKKLTFQVRLGASGSLLGKAERKKSNPRRSWNRKKFGQFTKLNSINMMGGREKHQKKMKTWTSFLQFLLGTLRIYFNVNRKPFWKSHSDCCLGGHLVGPQVTRQGPLGRYHLDFE